MIARRGDVQGLRAVAVLVVVAAHAGAPLLPGGFVGVDVFFVVSGYLIAGLLFREVAERGRVDLGAFWARRARRILPAATVVLAATVVATLVVLPLLERSAVIDDALWASVFLANVDLAGDGTAYFAQAAGTSPLQHYWSLAVEEQFYLVWPLALVTLLTLTAKSRRARRSGAGAAELPVASVGVLLALVVAASLAWSAALTAAAPSAAYFATTTRAWEIGVGALVALLVADGASRPGDDAVPHRGGGAVALLAPRGAAGRRSPKGSRGLPTSPRGSARGSDELPRSLGKPAARDHRPVPSQALVSVGASVLGVAGLTAILIACLGYGPATAFPGTAALLPVLGTAAVLLAGAGRSRPVTSRLLDTRALRPVGDRSYSLYLWHWPVLVLLERGLARPLQGAEVAAALVGVAALSALTYRFVEAPFRDGWPHPGRTSRRGLVLYPASVALVAATCGAGWYATELRAEETGSAPAVAADDTDARSRVRASVEAARRDVAVPSDLTPDLVDLRQSVADVGGCDYREDVRRLCPRGALTGSRTVVLIGDSHARAWIPAFDQIAEQGDWRAYYLVKSQCTAAHVGVAPLGEDRRFSECDDFHDWVEDQVRRIQPDLAVVTSSPPVNGVVEEGRRYEALGDVAPRLETGFRDLFADLRQSAARVVLLRDVPKSASDPGTCLSGTDSLASCLFEPVARSRMLADVSVAAAAASGTEVVDPTPWLCYAGECPVVIGGTLSYRDTDHITTEYAASLADTLGRALRMLGR